MDPGKLFLNLNPKRRTLARLALSVNIRAPSMMVQKDAKMTGALVLLL
jgi:hypothetical protein